MRQGKPTRWYGLKQYGKFPKQNPLLAKSPIGPLGDVSTKTLRAPNKTLRGLSLALFGTNTRKC
jgi:hypothetical protein